MPANRADPSVRNSTPARRAAGRNASGSLDASRFDLVDVAHHTARHNCPLAMSKVCPARLTGPCRLWPGRKLVRTPPDGMSTYNQCLGNRAVSTGLLTGPWDLNLAKGRGPGFESFARSRFSKSATRARCVSGLFRCFRDTIAPVHLGPKYPLGRLHHFPSGKSPRPPIAASRRFFSNRAASSDASRAFHPLWM
jgi:hypothetical protein